MAFTARGRLRSEWEFTRLKGRCMGSWWYFSPTASAKDKCSSTGRQNAGGDTNSPGGGLGKVVEL